MWLSLILGALGITGQLVMPHHRRTGWTIALTAQPLWGLFALTTGQYGLLLLTAGYTTAAVLGLKTALRSDRATPAGDAHP